MKRAGFVAKELSGRGEEVKQTILGEEDKQVFGRAVLEGKGRVT